MISRSQSRVRALRSGVELDSSDDDPGIRLGEGIELEFLHQFFDNYSGIQMRGE